jgi:hypothetical protein
MITAVRLHRFFTSAAISGNVDSLAPGVDLSFIKGKNME